MPGEQGTPDTQDPKATPETKPEKAKAEKPETVVAGAVRFSVVPVAGDPDRVDVTADPSFVPPASFAAYFEGGRSEALHRSVFMRLLGVLTASAKPVGTR